MNKLTFNLILVIILLVSCGKSTPKSDSEEVKKMAIESAINIIIDNANYIDKYLLSEYIKGNDVYYLEDAFRSNDLGNKDGVLKNVFHASLDSVIISAYQSGLFTLKDIRIISKDNNLRSCISVAEMCFKEKNFSITYTAQYTEDGNLHVESEFK
jgi:hypothetical protein